MNVCLPGKGLTHKYTTVHNIIRKFGSWKILLTISCTLLLNDGMIKAKVESTQLPNRKPWLVLWAISARISPVPTILYCSLAKERPWVEHLVYQSGLFWVFLHLTQNSAKWCLQQLNVLKANNWTNNNVQRNHQWLRGRVLMAHNTLNGTKWASYSTHCISCKGAL